MSVVGQCHATWLGQRLEASGHVDAVSVDCPVRLLDDLAQVDADPEAHTSLDGASAEGDLELLLDHPGRGCRRAGEVEDGQHRVAGHVDDPAPERFDLATEDGTS